MPYSALHCTSYVLRGYHRFKPEALELGLELGRWWVEGQLKLCRIVLVLEGGFINHAVEQDFGTVLMLRRWSRPFLRRGFAPWVWKPSVIPVDGREGDVFVLAVCGNCRHITLDGSAAGERELARSPSTSVPLISELKIAKGLCKALGSGDWGEAQAEVLKQLNIPLSPHRVNVVLKRLGGNVSMAWGFFNWTADQPGYKHTSHTFYTMLKLFASSGDVKAVETLLSRMRKESCPPDAPAYNVLVKCLGRLWKVREALAVMAHMQSLGCKPNKETYNSILNSLTRQRYYDEALRMYQQMLTAGCRPTNHTHAAMIRGLAMAGRTHDAFVLFDQMLSKAKCAPSEVAYGAILEAYAQEGNVQQVENLFMRMKAARLTPDGATYRLVAGLLRDAGKGDEADTVIWEMEYKHSGGRRRRGK